MFYLYKTPENGIFYLRNFGASLNCRESWLIYNASVCGVTHENDMITLADAPLSVKWHPKSTDPFFPFMRFGFVNYFIATDRPDTCPNRYAYFDGSHAELGTQAQADASPFWTAINF